MTILIKHFKWPPELAILFQPISIGGVSDIEFYYTSLLQPLCLTLFFIFYILLYMKVIETTDFNYLVGWMNTFDNIVYFNVYASVT